MGSTATRAARSVVLVDDDRDILTVITAQLARSGRYRVVGAATGSAEALEMAERTAPDIVLLDVNLQGEDGRDALPRLRQVAPKGMVVMLSSRAEEVAARTSLEAGAFAYLEKWRVADGLAEALDALYDEFNGCPAGGMS